MTSLITIIGKNGDYLASVATSYLALLVQLAVQFFLVPIYLQYFGKSDFGYLMMTMSLLGMAVFGLARLGGAVLRPLGQSAATEDWVAFKERYDSLKRLVIYLVPFMLAILWLGIGIIEINHWAKHSRLSDSALQIAIAAAVYVTVQVDAMFETWALTAVRRRFVANLLNLLAVACFVALVVPWVQSGGGPAAVFWSLAASVVLARLAAYVYWRMRGLSMRLRFSRQVTGKRVRELLGSTTRDYFVYGAIFAALQADVFILGAIADPRTAADYTLVWKIAEIVILVIWRLSDGLQPDLIRAQYMGGHARIAHLYRRLALWLAMLSAAIGLAYAVLGRWAVEFWVGEANTPDTELGYVLAGGAVFFLGTTRFVATFAQALGHIRPLIRLSLVELAAKWVGAAILLPFLGYLAVLASVNAIFVLGIGWGYVKLGQRLIKVDPTAAAVKETTVNSS